MKPRARIQTVASMVAFAAAVLLVVVLVVQGPPKQRGRLADGSVLTLEQVSFGRDHTYDDTPWWTRFVPARAPAMPRPLHSYPTNRDELVAWSRVPVGRGLAIARAYVVDEHGCCFASDEYDTELDADGKTGTIMWAFPAYPRGSAQFQIAFTQRTWHGEDGRFQVRAIPKVPPAAWSAAPYPITRSVDGLSVTLAGLSHRPAPKRFLSVADLRFRDVRTPAQRWTATTVCACDASGSRLESVPGSWGSGTTFYGLCAHEPAWKVRFALTPDVPLRRPPDVTSTVRVPKPNSAAMSMQSFRQQGLLLTLVRPGDTAGAARSRRHSGHPARGRLAVRFTAPQEGTRLSLLHAIDDRGRDLVPPVSAQTPGPHREDYSRRYYRGRPLRRGSPLWWALFDLAIPPDAGPLTLTFGVHRPRYVEFVAKPG